MILRTMDAPVNNTRTPRAERRGIQSVEIAVRVLTALQHSTTSLPLKEIAARAGLTASAANNYLVSLVRTDLVQADIRPGYYRLGPGALSLGMSALQQIDGYEALRREVTALRDVTVRNAALAGWSDAGPISLFKQDGEHRSAFEMRTGVIPVTSTASGKVFMACLPAAATLPLVRKELAGDDPTRAQEVIEKARKDLKRDRYLAVTRAHPSGYVSIAAPVWNMNAEVRFAIGLMDAHGMLDTSRGGPHVAALLETAARASTLLGGSAYIQQLPPGE
jgi:DNA-binding IclR family transcriptional regulator